MLIFPRTRSYPSIALAVCVANAVTAVAGAEPEYRIVRPSNTGIPGCTSMLFVDFSPDGRLWTTGCDFFWQQGGARLQQRPLGDLLQRGDAAGAVELRRGVRGRHQRRRPCGLF